MRDAEHPVAILADLVLTGLNLRREPLSQKHTQSTVRLVGSVTLVEVNVFRKDAFEATDVRRLALKRRALIRWGRNVHASLCVKLMIQRGSQFIEVN